LAVLRPTVLVAEVRVLRRGPYLNDQVAWVRLAMVAMLGWRVLARIACTSDPRL
jgi:hypothetical protein